MVTVRSATVDDLAIVLPRTRALNDHEGIAIADDLLAAALRTLLADADLGGVWMIEHAGGTVGYAIVTYGFDLEFGGRDAVLTEIYVDPAARAHGAGSAAIARIADELRALGVRALHLQVRPDNPAVRLYERLGFVASPRTVMTRRLV